MNVSRSFFKPHLIGKRFDDHTIPLELLRDFAVLEEMIIETAKWKYLEKNSERQRVPRGFANGVSLRLKAIEPGSAIPEFIYEINQESMFPEITDYLEEARVSIVSAISSVENNEEATDYMPANLLAYFDRFGRNLQDDEIIEFSIPNDDTKKAKLSKPTRKKLVLASKVSEITDEVLLRGVIPEADQAKMTFELQIVDGSKINAPISVEYMNTVLEAFQGYKQNTKVVLRGIGKFNRYEKLLSIEAIEHINILDALDVPSRIEELRSLGNGWLDGENGIALSDNDLTWFSDAFELNFDNDLMLPYLFPTPEGGLLLEWTINEHDLSLEVFLVKHSAQWHDYNMTTEEEEERVLDLNKSSDWLWISKKIRNYKSDDA